MNELCLLQLLLAIEWSLTFDFLLPQLVLRFHSASTDICFLSDFLSQREDDAQGGTLLISNLTYEVKIVLNFGGENWLWFDCLKGGDVLSVCVSRICAFSCIRVCTLVLTSKYSSKSK